MVKLKDWMNVQSKYRNGLDDALSVANNMALRIEELKITKNRYEVENRKLYRFASSMCTMLCSYISDDLPFCPDEVAKLCNEYMGFLIGEDEE